MVIDKNDPWEVGRFTCLAQVDAFKKHLQNSETLFWQTYWKIMLYLPPNCCPNHARSMKTSEAIEAIEFGTMRINNLSKRNAIDTIRVSAELSRELKVAIGIAGDCEYLFDARLTGSNRGASKRKPVSRQSSYRVISRSKSAVMAATRDAGIYDDFKFHQRTVLFYDASSLKTEEMLKDLVSLHGRNLSADFLVGIKRELTELNRKLNK